MKESGADKTDKSRNILLIINRVY